MPEYKVVSEEEHDRNLKSFFVGCKNLSASNLLCKECRSYIGCLKTRAYFLKGWVFDPLKKCYLDTAGRVVKKL